MESGNSIIDGQTYRKIKRMDRRDMEDFFYKILDTRYKDGYNKGVQDSAVSLEKMLVDRAVTSTELEDILLNVKGIGKNRTQQVMDKINNRIVITKGD